MKSLLVFLIILSMPLISAHGLALPGLPDLPDLPPIPGLPDPKVEVPEFVPVPDPIEPEIEEEIEPVEPTISREQIEKQKQTLAELRIDLAKYTRDQILKEAQILSFESSFNLAEKRWKDAKVVYDKNPDETKRLALVNAQDILSDKTDDLRIAENELIVIQDLIRNTNNQIIKLSELVRTDSLFYEDNKAVKSPKTIGIILSGTCITMLKNGIESLCPSYEFLMALNLDTSDYRSGSFDYDDNDFYHRGTPLVKNDHLLYDYNEYNIIIDPSATMFDRVATITISPNLGVYFTAQDMKKIDNTRIFHTDRFIQDCYRATITASTWLSTLDDTIFFMRNGCTGYLGGTIIEVEDPVTITNIAESSKWKYDQWLANIKEEYKEYKIGGDTNQNPSVIEDEDQ